LGDDALGRLLVESCPWHSGEKVAGVALGLPTKVQGRQPVKHRVLRRVTHRDQERDTGDPQPACDEGKYLRRRPVKPLRVIDHHEQCLDRRRVGEQGEHGKADKKSVRCDTGDGAEGGTEGVALRHRNPVQARQERGQQLMQPSEAQRLLRFDAHDPRQP
jgi:hypothetical protein